MLLNNKKIAIVGGGPAGLTLARLLQLKGAVVQVYERDFNERVRSQGATLDLHETSGLEAIRRAGVLAEFYQKYRPEAGLLRVVKNNMEIVFDDHVAGKISEQRPEIDRADLRDILLQSLQPGTVVWDCHFLSMEKAAEGWELFFKDGRSFYADIVIAADGANSKIRPLITTIQPVYSGITIVEGNIYSAKTHVPDLWSLVKGGKVFALGNEQSLILSTKGDGSLSFYSGTKIDEYRASSGVIDFTNQQQVFHWFKTSFSNWSKEWEVLFQTDQAEFIPRPQYHFPADQYWKTQSNLTMIGDAAHRMPPYAGEGVNMAMQDAFELAECMTGTTFNTIQEAINAFEQNMRKRAAEVTQMSLEATEQLHSPQAIRWILKAFQGTH
ncbi:FAD-dependent oxidoreductase [Gynurincola endophyticus]|uniref:FAD-dependent oxidoreductase n=1 Tax=Gynurincola endophyticus TaxID=2479004 RepID=UPI000F8EA2C2|nr:NAD(P)/FAD-dependent oxidoreductase [Gynurincola endophyticus]